MRSIWEESRGLAARSVNTAHVCANWLIGREIVEEEQAGKERADYGKELLKTLSGQMTGEYGTGFSVSSLQYMRAFYMQYPNLLQIQHAVRGESCNVLEDNMLKIQQAVRGESCHASQDSRSQIGHALRDLFRVAWLHPLKKSSQISEISWPAA